MKSRLCRIVWLALVAVAVTAGQSRAQTVNRDDILYIMPQWGDFFSASDATISDEAQELRQRLGPEGPYVKLGFTVYVFIVMNDWNVDPADTAAVRAGLSDTIAVLDTAIAKARAHHFPIAISFLTAIRDRYDPVQRASEAEDVRSMQWYADNVLAPGWWSQSRYARKQFAVQEAYVRELGKVVANRMSLYPDTLVAAAGDGEVELAFARNTDTYADYSPFAVAEFRDWIRHAGLYADGAAFGGQGYTLGSRYAGDATPDQDTNGDGHTLNGDFNTSFSTWSLLHFDWSLSDSETADPHAIPLSTYSADGFVRQPGTAPGGFDAPRVPRLASDTSDPWWNVWAEFKPTMIQRHNQEFARWMTTSPDPATGFSIPSERWYSYQIPADYMFNSSPANPNGRYYSSASSWTTADISPYGSFGITAFNIDFTGPCGYVVDYGQNCFWAVTLSAVAPAIAGRDLRWGLLEWNPGELPNDSGTSPSAAIYQFEMDLIKLYRPSFLSPYAWNNSINPIKDTAFETALKQLVADLRNGTPANPRVVSDIADGATLTPPFALTGWAADLAARPGLGTGIDRVEVTINPRFAGPSIDSGAVAYGRARSDAASANGHKFANSGFATTIRDLAPGAYDIVIRGRSPATQAFSASTTVSINVEYPATASPAMLRFGARRATAGPGVLATTPPQLITASHAWPDSPAWTAVADQPWIQVTSGPNAGQFRIGILESALDALPRTSLSGSVIVSAVNVGLSVSVPVTLFVTDEPGEPPFGAFDTPVGGNTPLSGSIAVTGWALDDVGIDRVEIWREVVPGESTIPYSGPGPGNGKVFIANGLFIDGSRRDVEAAYSDAPQSSRAGWGYLMLTRGLPNDGNGSLTLSAFAYDLEGHDASLGTKTIVLDNAGATKPFGAIDTPGYGATVSGGIWNYGWALTPGSDCRIINGSVLVGIDSGPPMAVNFGDVRADIASNFPGFTNTDGAGGAFFIDTTTLANGTHQIGWLVTDNCGRQDGVGSRFFSVLNIPGQAP